jgi:hypothetical protein
MQFTSEIIEGVETNKVEIIGDAKVRHKDGYDLLNEK